MKARRFSGARPGLGAIRTDERPQPVPRVTMLVRTGRPAAELVMAHSPRDPRAEQLRALRTELLLRSEPQGADIVALLSPCRGEGRSQLAAELAIAFAQLGRRTLLVDADLRYPRQHMLFGVDDRLGLAHAILSGLAPHLHTVDSVPGMFLVTAGASANDPLELLMHDRFTYMVEDWSRDYDFVVVDTPAVTPYSDGLAIAGLVGRVLTLSRAQHTPYRDTRDMLRRLAATRADILGAVISHF